MQRGCGLPPADSADAYLRLHLLSHRLVRPNSMNLDGIFKVLPNVCWTSLGPVAVSEIGARGHHPAGQVGQPQRPAPRPPVTPPHSEAGSGKSWMAAGGKAPGGRQACRPVIGSALTAATPRQGAIRGAISGSN